MGFLEYLLYEVLLCDKDGLVDLGDGLNEWIGHWFDSFVAIGHTRDALVLCEDCS